MMTERDTLRPELHCDGNVCSVDLVYPRHTGIDTVEVGLCDVRAAGAIRVSYDFERDGWVIKQDRNTHVPDPTNPPEEAEEDWVEVYFADAWEAKPVPEVTK
jgi:hypothetical protein